MKFKNRSEVWSSGMALSVGLDMLLGAATDLELAVGGRIGVAVGVGLGAF